MLFDPQNFLQRLQEIVTGDRGFMKDVSLAPQGIATTGTRATAENSVPADAIVLDADDEDVIVAFTIPRDYDEENDLLKVKLLVAYVSGTSLTLQADSVARGNASTIWADEADFTAATADTINAAFSIGEVEADLSSLDWQRHDALAVNFVVAGATSTPVAHVLGARVEYRSCLVSYDAEDSSGVDLR